MNNEHTQHLLPPMQRYAQAFELADTKTAIFV